MLRALLAAGQLGSTVTRSELEDRFVELDGHATHATGRAFEGDRDRDRRLTAAGWRVVRVTWRQLHGDACALTTALRRLLA